MCKIWKLYSSPVALTLAECSLASHSCFSVLSLPLCFTGVLYHLILMLGICAVL